MRRDDHMLGVEAVVDGLHRAGQDAWPGIEVARSDLAGLVADRMSDRLADPALWASIGADLYLACACAAGDPRALAAFEARYIAPLPGALRRLRLAPSELDEVLQIVRTRLLVGAADRPPRIRDAAGRGALGALVRVVAIRSALNLRRGEARRPDQPPPGDDLVELLAGEVDPAGSMMRAEEREALKRAFQDALGQLAPRERNLLRLHLRHRLGIDEIGRLHRVHRATAARWLERVRDQLRRETRRLLADRLRRPVAELDSVIQLVDSRLEISFDRLLGTHAG